MVDYKLGVGTFILRERAQRELFVIFDQLHEIGYDGLELLGLFGRTPADIRKKLDSLPMTAIGDHVSVFDFESNADMVIGSHREIGCKYLTLSCPSDLANGSENEIESLIRRVGHAARLCRNAGITPLYHNHGFDMMGERPFTARVMDACADDGLCLEPDVGWMTFAGCDPVDYLERYRDRCPVIHLKDIYADDVTKIGPASSLTGIEGDPQNAGFAFRPTGYGIVNFPRIIRYAIACNPDWLMVDHDLAYARDSIADLKLSHDYVRALMALCL